MFDHLGIEVSDYETSRSFYERALGPLGMAVLMEPIPSICGFGPTEGIPKPYFWIGTRTGKPQTGVHIAFAAESREQVDAFHEAALAAGAANNGGPGVREIYHPNYYGAFVLDPDGNNVEAVCHTFS
jgi:catechol 2,3-dioxygenase-like lactoylglutathione lyase family enzyme